MANAILKVKLVVCLMLLPAAASFAQVPPAAATSLAGSSWQFVKFPGSDDKTLIPADKSKYTLAFNSDGRVVARIDCNRGTGSWKSAGPNQIEIGPLAMTRAMCPGAPLTDRLPKDLGLMRSYLLKDGHLFLSLMADGGIYELEPQATSLTK